MPKVDINSYLGKITKLKNGKTIIPYAKLNDYLYCQEGNKTFSISIIDFTNQLEIEKRFPIKKVKEVISQPIQVEPVKVEEIKKEQIAQKEEDYI